jgi:hypothetical protein
LEQNSLSSSSSPALPLEPSDFTFPLAQWSPPPSLQVISITQPMLSAHTWYLAIWGKTPPAAQSLLAHLLHLQPPYSHHALGLPHIPRKLFKPRNRHWVCAFNIRQLEGKTPHLLNLQFFPTHNSSYCIGCILHTSRITLPCYFLPQAITRIYMWLA